MTHRNLNYYLCTLLLFFATIAEAQYEDNKSIPFLSFRADLGQIIQTNDFLKGDNLHSTPMTEYYAYMLEVGLQSRGSKEWQQLYDFPSYGVGVYTATLDNRAEIGRPWSLFGFYRGTFFRSADFRHTFRYNIELGLATNWHCYDEQTNPKNITIGSPVTAHLGLGLDYSYALTSNAQIGLGAGFTHFSNGAVRKPNKGLNLMSVGARLTYLLNPESYPTKNILPKKKDNEIDFTFGMGVKRYECDTTLHPELTSEFKLGSRYMVSTLQVVYLHQYCHKGKYGLGVSVTYDEWLGSDTRTVGDDVEVILGPTRKRFNFGLVASHEFCIANLSIPTQLGVYLYQPKGISQQKKKLFQRMGVKYSFNCGLQAGVNIYAHQLSKADFIEWNLGYRLRISRKNAKS